MRPERAFQLQRGFDMKRIAVAMLAVLLLGACGVGMDEDVEGWEALGVHQDAIASQADGGAGVVSTGMSVATTPMRIGMTYQLVALPQDPVPVRPGHKPCQVLDCSGDGN